MSRDHDHHADADNAAAPIAPAEVDDDEFDDDDDVDDDHDVDDDEKAGGDGAGDSDEDSELRQPAPPGTDPLAVLTDGTIEIIGRMPWSSNATFLVAVHLDGIEARAIYKPGRGERPLWDFPNGLFRREVAAYRLSEAMGVRVIPPTVVRNEGPYGEGSLQWFIPADFREHYFTLHEQRPDLHSRFVSMAVFDVIANNTDRKSGHVLHGPLINGGDLDVWGIDNGLCFAAEFKLRTVIWEFAGQALGAHDLAAVNRIAKGLPLDVAVLLDDDEAAAVIERACGLAAAGRLPTDPTGRRYPWPLV